MGCLHSNPAVLPSGIISRQFHTEKQRKRAQKNMEARMQTALKLIVDHKASELRAESCRSRSLIEPPLCSASRATQRE